MPNGTLPLRSDHRPGFKVQGYGQLIWQFRQCPAPASPLRGLSRITASGEHETIRAVLVLGELVRHRQQEPPIRARHRLKGLNQPLYRLAQGDLIGNLGRGRLSLTDEKQLVRFNFQSFGKFFQSLERRSCVSTFNTRDVRAQETGAPFDVALRKTLNFT